MMWPRLFVMFALYGAILDDGSGAATCVSLSEILAADRLDHFLVHCCAVTAQIIISTTPDTMLQGLSAARSEFGMGMSPNLRPSRACFQTGLLPVTVSLCT